MPRVQATTIGLLALLITPGYLFYFDVTPKLALLLFGLAAALLCGPRLIDKPVLISWLVGLSLLSLAVSTALSSNPALSLFGSTWRRYGAIGQAATLLFAWLVAAAGKAAIRPILRAVAVAGLIAGAYGIAQYLGWDPLLPAAAYHVGEGIWTIVRPPGTLGYASYFATWLLSAIFLSAAVVRADPAAPWRRLALAAILVATLALLFTGTRAALAGLFAGVVVSQWRRPPGLRVFLAFLLLPLLYLSPLGQPLRSRARWFAEDPWGGARLRLWSDSLRMAAHRLPAGFGPEVFTSTFPQFESKDLARAYPDFAHESPHNMFLDALVQQGAPGMLLLLAFCGTGFAAVWRLRLEQPALAAALAGALSATIVSQQFTAFTIPTALMFYVTVALAIGPGRETAESRWHWKPALLTAPLALALIYLAVRFVAADRALEISRQSIQSGDVTKSAAGYATYESRRLPGAAADLWFSRALYGLASTTPNPIVRFQALLQAGLAGERATHTAEEPFNAWYNLAALAATQNDAAAAERCLRSAISAHPNWFKPHWTLARLLRLESRLPDALSEAELAVDLDAGKDPEVTRTLEDIRRSEPFHE